jgi:hypothetical protein
MAHLAYFPDFPLHAVLVLPPKEFGRGSETWRFVYQT